MLFPEINGDTGKFKCEPIFPIKLVASESEYQLASVPDPENVDTKLLLSPSHSIDGVEVKIGAPG